MHRSGIVDIQSHSLTHSRINISPKVVDFIHPGFDTYFYENINVPISRDDYIERPLRQIRLGEPVYKSASRFSGSPRFLEDPSIRESLVRYVAENGAETFFSRFSWRRQLERKYRSLVESAGIQASCETPKETEAAIRLELTRSKQLIECRLPGKSIRHFCYPWFQSSSLSDRIAADCGYDSVFDGLETNEKCERMRNTPLKIRRISEKYMFCLPGYGRHSLRSVWAEKLFHCIHFSTIGT